MIPDKIHRRNKNIVIDSNELLLKRIKHLGFKAWELEVYLKINPHDKKALEYFRKYKAMQKELRN